MVTTHTHDWYPNTDPPWPILLGFVCGYCKAERLATEWEKDLWHDAYAVGYCEATDYLKNGPRPGTPPKA